jgi:hypothetical protein
MNDAGQSNQILFFLSSTILTPKGWMIAHRSLFKKDSYSTLPFFRDFTIFTDSWNDIDS